MSGFLKTKQVINDHGNDVTSVDFCKNMLATASNDKTVRLYRHDKASHKFEEVPSSPFKGHTYGVNMVRFSPCGKFLVSCSRDGFIIFLSVDEFTVCHIFSHNDTAWIRAICFSTCGPYLATAGESLTIKIWNYVSATEFKSFSTNEISISCLIFSPDGEHLITGDFEGRLVLWDAQTLHKNSLCIVNEAHDLTVNSCDMIESETSGIVKKHILATTGNDDFIKIWQMKGGNIELLIKCSDCATFSSSCSFITQDLMVSIGSDRNVHFWNCKTGTTVLSFPSHQRNLLCCAYSNGFLATGSGDRSLVVWELDISKIATAHPSTVSLLDVKNIQSWTCNDVALFMDKIGLSHYLQCFLDSSVDGQRLSAVTCKDLLDIGIKSYQDQMKILASISSPKKLDHPADEEEVPAEFLCPITLQIMKEAVVAADGYSYEKKAIIEWFETGCIRSPVTNEDFEHDQLIPNYALRSFISRYKSLKKGKTPFL